MRRFVFVLFVFALVSSLNAAEVEPELTILQGQWEKRIRFGMSGTQVSTLETYQNNGTGSISIKLLEWQGGKFIQKNDEQMQGTIIWSLDDEIFSRKYGNWKNTIKNITVEDDSLKIKYIDNNVVILFNKNLGDLTIRQRYVPNQSYAKSIETKLKINGMYELEGTSAYRLEDEGSLNFTGSPAILQWIDAETGFINYLLAMHIEYYKPSQVFIATGGPTLIEGLLQTVNPSRSAQMVLFSNGDSILPNGNVYWLNRNPGEELQFSLKQ